MPEHDDELSAALREYYSAMAQHPAPDVAATVMRSTERRNARIRRWGAVGGGALAAAAVGAVVAVALVSHHQPNPGAPARSATPAPSASIAPPTVAPSATALPLVAGPPLQDFVPTDVTAISAGEWWVLGYNGACLAALPANGGNAADAAACTRIAHTTDGGHSFSSIPAPPVAHGSAGKSLRMRFADAADGWVISPGTVVWATHDGGAHWSRTVLPGDVMDLAASGGAVYAVSCNGSPSCTLERSPVGTDRWSPLPASDGYGSLNNLDVNGASVWAAIASPAGGPGRLIASTNRGESFTVQTACPSALGYAGEYAVDATTLWATCATGTEASAYRSTDGGQSYTQLSGSISLPNRATIAGVSSDVAVIGGQTLIRTTDGGHTFATVENQQSQWTVVGFTTSQDGFAFDIDPSGQSHLWRTDDAGASWHAVQFP